MTISDKDILRLLRRLSARGAVLSDSGTWTRDGRRIAASGVEMRVVETAMVRGLLSRGDGRVSLTDTGGAMLRRSLSEIEDYAAQHQDRSVETVTDEAGIHSVVVNHDESPLAWLRRRRDATGKPMIDATEYAAGERLRSDYTRGQLAPRVTANWSAAVATKGRAAGEGEITEVALAARQRVERALEAAGPELAGLLVDFCCFLKGLEEIERERRWPARSAKVALRIGLASLARHYGLSREARGPKSSRLLHWGTEDYRPTID